MRETADIDESNNTWPKEIIQTKFEVFKAAQQGGRNQPNNPMQKAKEKKKAFYKSFFDLTFNPCKKINYFF